MEAKEIRALLVENELCNKYMKIWADDVSKEDIFSASLTGAGLEYVVKHDFITPTFVMSEFAEYVNSRSVSLPDGRKGQMWVGVKDYVRLFAEADVIHIMGSVVVLNIPDWWVGEITLSRGSKVIIEVGKDSIIFIDLYDKSKATLVGSQASEDNTVRVYCRDGECVSKLNYDNNIIIK